MRSLEKSASCLLIAASFCLLPRTARSEVKPHRLFSDHAVLQQGVEVPVWGTAAEGEKVTVRFQDQSVEAAAKDGKWQVRLNKLSAGGPFEMTIAGQNTVQIKDVLVGEVWVASGQSNMQWPVAASADPDPTIANSKNDMIRLITVPRRAAARPEDDIDAQWTACGPETVADFSAVAYFFGRELQQHLNVPVGLISTNYGGTVAEAWTSKETLAANPELQSFVAQPPDPNNANTPTGLYNAMIHPLVPFAIQGAIWYQGESNAGRAWQYRTLFPAMIGDWRKAWSRGDFPFLFVQLAPFMKIEQQPGDSAWAELRDAQLQTSLTVPNTAQAVITDVGDEVDIHPKQKAPVGQRLALAARALAYGEQIEYSGPVYSAIEIADGKARLSFKHLGDGLEARGGDLTGFSIAGADRKFVNAYAAIEGDRVVVSSPETPQPVAVRYGWANYPLGNLWNKNGLPASPFRTDDFPLTTQPQP